MEKKLEEKITEDKRAMERLAEAGFPADTLFARNGDMFLCVILGPNDTRRGLGVGADIASATTMALEVLTTRISDSISALYANKGP